MPVRVEFWPSIRHSANPSDCIALDLNSTTVNFFMEVGLLIPRGSNRAGSYLRYQIKSTAMFLTLCQNRQRREPELVPVVSLLKAGANLSWEIHILADEWRFLEEDDTPAWWEAQEKEVSHEG
jgi:hypothetical protein